jgi:hypothetical protein
MDKTRTLKVSIPHHLPRHEAVRRLQEGFAGVKQQFSQNLAQVDERWTGDHLDLKATAFGQSIAARLDVRDSAVDVEIELPWLFAMLAEKIKGQVVQAGQKLLEKK